MDSDRDTVLYFLHGSGGSGPEVRGFLQTVPIPDFDYKTFAEVLEERKIDLVTPTARPRPYMPCGNDEASVWFNRSPTVFRLGTLDTYEDVTGTEDSMNQILTRISESGGKYKNVIVGGLSMGGGLALYLLGKNALPECIKGIFSMGSFLVDSTSLFQPPRQGGLVNNRIPVFMMHGEDDDMINPVWGSQTGSFLTIRGFDVRYKTYRDVRHEIGLDELVDLVYWIDDIVTVDGCPDAEQRRAMDEAMEKYTDDFMDVDHKAVVDAGDPMPIRPPAASTTPMTHAPYSIEPYDGENDQAVSGRNDIFLVHYNAPVELIPTLSSRPVLACGSEFSITPTSKGVQCIIQSSDPEKTAMEIGKRLLNRMNSGETELNVCPMM